MNLKLCPHCFCMTYTIDGRCGKCKKRKIQGDRMKEYHSEFYNKSNETEQWIRLSDGCYRNCWNCYCPKVIRWYPIPVIKRNRVVFLDMNFIYAYPNPRTAIEYLGKRKVNNKVVYYHFQCGLDFTLITPKIANALKKARFGRFNNKRNWISGLQLAWDRGIKEKEQFQDCIINLKEAGYSAKNIQVFMLCNGKISFKESVEKLKVLAEMGLQICDCWYDNQRRGTVKPIHWKADECLLFGKLCRAHNIAIQQNMYDSIKYLINAEGRLKV